MLAGILTAGGTLVLEAGDFASQRSSGVRPGTRGTARVERLMLEHSVHSHYRLSTVGQVARVRHARAFVVEAYDTLDVAGFRKGQVVVQSYGRGRKPVNTIVTLTDEAHAQVLVWLDGLEEHGLLKRKEWLRP